MSSTQSQMRREILEIPEAIDRLLTNGTNNIQKAAQAARDTDPAFIVTIARGSSDHVCTYLKYASELLLGIPVASIGPSVASIYKAPLKLNNSLSISVSQSGKSPDIVEMTRATRRDGALAVAITNEPASPLAETSDHRLDIHAGAELSVAATKTFVTSAVAGLMLLAHWRNDDKLLDAIKQLPTQLERAAAISWPEVCEAIGNERSLYTLGRGPVSAISNEAALKFKETCQIHAESYSSAEVLHGPVSIVEKGFPVLCFASADAAEGALVSIADEIASKGAKVFVTSERASKANSIDHIRTNHALTDPLSLIVSFYTMVERVAAARGVNPDMPRHLKKVTETL
jgi:glucosamine--fructose-6-phosphate aminotransferase (isomerizing)